MLLLSVIVVLDEEVEVVEEKSNDDFPVDDKDAGISVMLPALSK
jgi:hypothetical protein